MSKNAAYDEATPMYIYDRKFLGAQSLLKEQRITSQPAQRNYYYPDRGTSGFLVRRGIGSTSVWTNEGFGGPEDDVKALMKELQPLFLKNFSKKRITYGPKVGSSVKFRVVPVKDFKSEVVKEAQRLANNTVHLHLKFAPELVRKDLERFYKSINQPFPARLKIIDENTKLTPDEKVAIFTLLQVLTVEKAKTEADKMGAFYSPLAQEIVFRESQIDAGTVAHEMAHAYADQGWHDFIHMMKLRRMKETNKLDEGMATHIERIIVKEWWKKQPSSTAIPLAAYDSTYTDRANEFIKALGKDRAYEAYFGGWIDFTSNAKPESTLVIGKKKKKKWKWPWTHTIVHFQSVFR